MAAATRTARIASDVASPDGESIGNVDGIDFVVRSASALRWTNATYDDMAIALTTESEAQCAQLHGAGWAPGYGPTCNAIGGSDDAAGCPVGPGTITLMSVASTVTGSFDVTVDGVHLAGSFEAATCGPDAGPPGVGTLDTCK